MARSMTTLPALLTNVSSSMVPCSNFSPMKVNVMCRSPMKIQCISLGGAVSDTAVASPRKLKLEETAPWSLADGDDGSLNVQANSNQKQLLDDKPSSSSSCSEDRQPQVSVGSALHDGKGLCKPCGFFWTPRGCMSGASCRHCHMCPRGERAQRRRTGAKRGAAAQTLDVVKLPIVEELASNTSRGMAFSISEATTTDDDAESIVLAPSLGSRLHDGTGKCRPCGFFWSVQGCIRGQDCGHCHLCPKGERERRKKAGAPRGDQLFESELPEL